MREEVTPVEMLHWYLEAGVDAAIGNTPLDRYALSAELMAKPPETTQETTPEPTMAAQSFPTPASNTSPIAARQAVPAAADSALEATANALETAQAAKSLEELKAAMDAFEGCALKATATNLVFADGNPESRVMVIGEAPGPDEDRQGLPFVGANGQFLDRMLASIGLDRTSYYITNVIPWRPPGNRKPTSAEVAVCMPFLERHIELVDPEFLLLVGGLSASTVLASPDGIMRLRGKWEEYSSKGLSHPIPTLATFHPKYLQSQPRQKRLAWQDLLALKQRLKG